MVEPKLLIDTPFKEIFDRDPIYDSIFSRSSPATLARFGCTCQIARRALQDYRSRAFDINTHLRRYISEPKAFRDLQARTGAIISGSTALQFMDRTFYPEADLDVYVYPQDYLDVGRFFMRDVEMGYVFKPNSRQDPDFEKANITLNFNPQIVEEDEIEDGADLYQIKGVQAVFTFISTTTPIREKVQVIVVHNSPLECILNFHSTVVMNAISHCAAYSLYPKATFEERLSLSFGWRVANSEAALAKYAQRGWRTIVDIFPHNELSPSPSFEFSERWITDKTSWVLPLDMTGVNIGPAFSLNTPPLSFDPLTMNGWELVRDESTGQPFMIYHVINTKLFVFRYTAHGSFLHYITKFLRRQGQIEYAKRERPGIERDAWTWWDSVLPAAKAEILLAKKMGIWSPRTTFNAGWVP